MGQINSLVLVLLALFIFWYRSRPTAAGAVLALAIAIKLYPLFILPYLLIDKQRRMVTSFISTMILIATMTYLMLPPAVIKSFFSKTLPSLMNTGRGTNYYDQSLYAFVARALPDIDTLDISRTVVIMLLILTYAFLWFHREKVRNNYLGISLILIINLLFSNFTWQHHFIWLLLPLFITYRYIHRTNPYRRYYIIYAVSYALLAFNFKNPSGLHFLLLSNQFYGALLLYCLIIFMILSSPSAPVVAKKYKHNKITQHTP